MTWTLPCPAGTVVRAVHPELGIPMRQACRGHLFRIMNSAVPVEASYSECRFIQAATCLVCGYVTANLDADWFVEATEEDINDCIRYVDQIINHLKDKREHLVTLTDKAPTFILPGDL
jgi:hypothetical protein